ncbi:hypothetical protein [Nocardia lijiangensis]|uniref:hypothetical protein n=1 Tax=Nocardia lijiangensis TaxID=299618 RepID=UPI003D722B72
MTAMPRRSALATAISRRSAWAPGWARSSFGVQSLTVAADRETALGPVRDPIRVSVRPVVRRAGR